MNDVAIEKLEAGAALQDSVTPHSRFRQAHTRNNGAQNSALSLDDYTKQKHLRECTSPRSHMPYMINY